MEGVSAKQDGDIFTDIAAAATYDDRHTVAYPVLDLSHCLFPPTYTTTDQSMNTKITALRTAIRTELLNNVADSPGLFKDITLEQIKNNALTNQEFLKVKKRIFYRG